MPKHHSPSHRQLLSLQRRIFSTLRAEALALLGPAPPAIRRYQQDLDRELRNSGPLSDKETLIAKVRSARLTLISDFHTFGQAQRTALRIMRKAVQPGEPWSIGLELAPISKQKDLDAYQAGRISTEEFHRRMDYNRRWGFPWAHYAPIFEWARENGIPLIALNSTGALQERDRRAARVIAERLTRTDERMLVLIGELHISRKHLPLECQRAFKRLDGDARPPLSPVIVHQNHDALYWKLARKGLEHQTNVIRLRESVFCVISGTPWAKQQSLVTWAESGGLHGEDESDPLSTIRWCGNAITRFLDIPPASFETLTIRTADEADFVSRLKNDARFTARELAILREQVARNQRIYIPRAKIAYLGTPSPNGPAEIAAFHLFRESTENTRIADPDPDDFFRLVLQDAFGFFGSLILNPRRKCDFAADHRARLLQLRKGGVEIVKHEAEARRLVLTFLPLKSSARWPKNEVLRRLSQKRSVATVVLTARYLGRLIGHMTHESLLTGQISKQQVCELYLSPPSARGSYEQRVRELADLIVRKTRRAAASGRNPRETSKSDVL